MGPILTENMHNIMKNSNAVKQVASDLSGTVGNSGRIVSGLTLATTNGALVLSEEAVKGVNLAPAAIMGTIKGVKALFTAPKYAVVGYVKEDRQITLAEATEVVEAAMPDSVAEAITSGAIGLGELTAMLLAEAPQGYVDDVNKAEAEAYAEGVNRANMH